MSTTATTTRTATTRTTRTTAASGTPLFVTDPVITWAPPRTPAWAGLRRAVAGIRLRRQRAASARSELLTAPGWRQADSALIAGTWMLRGLR